MIKSEWLLDPKYIEEIRQIRDKCERREKLHGVVNWKLPKEEFSWVLPALGIEGTITGGNFWSTPNPFHVHTDTGKQEELNGLKPKYNIVIPLNWHPSFNTIIFDQKWNGDAVHFWVGSIYKYFPDPVYNERKENFDGVEGLTSREFDIEYYKEYLTHLPYETLYGLSIAETIPWMIGNAMVFDSQYLHCSSNFVGTKEGVTILVGNDA